MVTQRERATEHGLGPTTRTFPAALESDLATNRLWRGVDDLLDRQMDLSRLRAHRLHLLAAQRWRRRGIGVPGELEADERATLLYHLAAGEVLRRVRSVLDGPVIVFKGPEVASHFPVPATRPFADIDLVVPNPGDAHAALLAAGFAAATDDESYYDGLHHVQPLYWPSLPVPVELHHHPNWIEWCEPPTFAELAADAVPSRTGIPCLLAPERRKHALMLAVNAWSDEPLRRVLDLVDIAAVLAGVEPAAVEPLADKWDVSRIWRSTTAAMDHMIFGGRRPLLMRTWGRAAAGVRDITVAENHVRRLASDFWSLPFHRALRIFPRTLAREILPSEDEPWRPKLARMRAAFRNAFRRRSQHNEALGEHARRLARYARKRQP